MQRGQPLEPPGDRQGGIAGIVVGFVVCGVLFVLMGATPLLIWASVARGNRRTHRALDAARAGATTTVPAPRRQSGAATLDEEVGR